MCGVLQYLRTSLEKETPFSPSVPSVIKPLGLVDNMATEKLDV